MEPKPDPLNDQLCEVDPRLPEFIEPLLTIVNGCSDKRVQRAALQTAALVGAYLAAERFRGPKVLVAGPVRTGEFYNGRPMEDWFK